MQSKKIEDMNLAQQGGDMAQIAMAVAKQQQDNMIVLNKDLLPSKGRFYPQDLRVKKMSTIDIKNLSTLTLETFDGTMNSIIAHNVKGINVNDILIGDKFWLIFYLRNLTYNDYPYSLKYHCPNCDKYATYKIQQKDLTVTYLKDDFKPEYTMDNSDTVELCFPTIGTEVQKNQILKEPEKYTIDGEIDKDILHVACFIKSINGTKVSIMKAYEYICNLDPISFTNFGNYMADVDFGVKTVIDVECDCKNIVKVQLSLSPDYFMPKIPNTNK